MDEQEASLIERMDPGGDIRDVARGMSLLSDLSSSLGLGDSFTAEAGALNDQMRTLFSSTEKAFEKLSPLGWPPLEQANLNVYTEAADLVSLGRPQDAVDLIVDSWNEDGIHMLQSSIHRVRDLYRIDRSEYPNLGRPDVAEARSSLIQEAFANHEEGRFASATTLAFSQIDGITADFSDEGYAFFSRIQGKTEPRATLTDDRTFAGHPQALKAIAVSLTERCDTTETQGRLLRHGIIHGRELEYGTKENSTKALVTLLAVITFVEEKAKRQLLAEVEKHEQEVAGLAEYDEDGRWKDRRDFKCSKKSLWFAQVRQDKYAETHGRYAGSIKDLDPNEAIDELRPVKLEVTEDGSAYWAWVTPNAYTLGIGCRLGEVGHWRYAAPTPPTHLPQEGGQDSWRSELEDQHPDWIP